MTTNDAHAQVSTINDGSMRNAADLSDQRETKANNEKPMTFFRFPAEVRNEVYLELISWHDETRNGRDLLDQPAITKVSRQARAEALPLYYGKSAGLRIKTDSSTSWEGAVQRLMDLLTGGPNGLPGVKSTLHYVTSLELTFATRDPAVALKVYFKEGEDTTKEQDQETEMITGRDDEIEQDEEAEFMDDYDLPYERRTEGDVEIVRVGSPDMDWTDPEAVQLACFNAVDEIQNNLKDRLLTDPELDEINISEATNEDDIEAALDAMCVVATACPRLTGSVSIADFLVFKTQHVQAEE